jgi:hypothetical protein
MSDTRSLYADAVGALLDKGCNVEELTEVEILQQALDIWLRRQIDLAIDMHAAGGGNGHQREDRCESWYALHDCLTMMHDETRRFAQAIMSPEGKP